MHRYTFLFLLLPIYAFAQPQYTIQDLGTLPSLPSGSCTGTAISQAGIVAGYCNAAGGSILFGVDTQPFVYSKGVLTALGLTNQPAVPLGVNDSGVVVGGYVNISLTTGLSVSPFIYQNSSVQTFAGIPGGALPFGLTNSGQSAATVITAGGENFFIASQAFQITTAGTATSLSPSSGSEAVAFGISPSGAWVSGGSGSAVGKQLGSQTPTLWNNGTAQALPLVPNFTYASMTGVNDSGMAAGTAFTFNFSEPLSSTGTAHAVLYNNGAMTDLGTLSNDTTSAALGINNSGTVVGYSSGQVPDITLFFAPLLEIASASSHAIVYMNGTMYDLNSQLTNGAGWQLTAATAINNAGQIVGTGLIQQQQHAFLLTPVPAVTTPPPPAVTSVVGAGLSVPAVNSLSANGLFTLFGTGFTAAGVKQNVTPADLTNNALPTNLANTCVQGGSTKWALIYVSATQINAVADPLSTSGNLPVSVITNCGQANETPTAAVNVTVAAVTPQFLFDVQNPTGQNEIVATEQDGSQVGPTGLIPGGEPFAPAHAGDILTAYGVGWGTTTPAAVVGSLAPSGTADITAKYTLTVGGMTAAVSYAGLAPTFAGLYQIDFTVPAGLSAGNQPIVLTVDGVATPAGAFLAVQ
jgi:uncharacterized protein (TIGR03437 family)